MTLNPQDINNILKDGKRIIILFLLIDGKIEQFIIDLNYDIVTSRPKKDRSEGKVYLYRKREGENGNSTPKEVYFDGYLNDKIFVSMCGCFCSVSDYEKTEQYKVFETSGQAVYDPVTFEPMHKLTFDGLVGPVKFSDIPSECKLPYMGPPQAEIQKAHSSGIDVNLFFGKLVDKKYDIINCWRERDTIEKYIGRGSVYGEEGADYAVNKNFYEIGVDDKWYSPTKRIVKVKRFISKNYFLSEDGYICKAFHYYMGFLSQKEYDKLLRRRWYLLTQI